MPRYTKPTDPTHYARTEKAHRGQVGKRLTDAQRAHIVEWCRDGVSRNEIARRIGCSGSTVSGVVKQAGVSFRPSRSGQPAATAQRKANLSERRQRIIDRELSRVEHLQDRREAAKFKTVFKGEYGSEYVKTLDFVPTVDERNIADTISRSLASTSRLMDLEQDSGADGAKSLLADLGRALGLKTDDGP